MLSYQMTNNSTRTNALLMVAVYDSSGRLERMTLHTIELVNGLCTEDLSAFTGAAAVRLFWADSISDHPLCANMELDLSR